MKTADGSLKCDGCGKKIAEADIQQGRIEWVCPRCKRFNVYKEDLTTSHNYVMSNIVVSST